MILRKTEKLYWQNDKKVIWNTGNQDREYRRSIYWFLFIPIYTTYEIVSKRK